MEEEAPLLNKSGKGLAGRSLVALLLFVGYYVLALVVAGTLFFTAYALTLLHIRSAVLLWSCVLAGGLVLWSIIPRIDRFVMPGPRLSPEAHPRLFEEIRGVARALHQKVPQDVYLVPEPNAWVAQRGGLIGIGSRRVMGLGLPYLQIMSLAEFRAVLAHEFGHYWGGDTKLAPWVFKTRANIGRTLESLASRNPDTASRGWSYSGIFAKIKEAAMRPFELYGHMFIRVTSGISRRQEFVADELASACAGRKAAISGLRKSFLANSAYGSFWEDVLLPAVDAGFLPPYAAGFGSFLECEAVKRGITEALEKEMAAGASEEYDSHPSLKERIGALSALPAGPSTEAAGEPAISLLGELQDLELELFRSLNPAAGASLKPIAWHEVLGAVYVPYWESLAQKHRSDLSGITLGNLPEIVGRLNELSTAMTNTAQLALVPDRARGYAIYVLYAAAASKLVKLGWQASAEFVGFVKLSHADLSWEPLPRISELMNGEMPADQWQELCARLGIAEVETACD